MGCGLGPCYPQFIRIIHRLIHTHVWIVDNLVDKSLGYPHKYAHAVNNEYLFAAQFDHVRHLSLVELCNSMNDP
ncbi:hypothetical protein PCURB6_42050 [Paenibacillus curdlanolyticus]|nr:hypothetical protein PCURB6_42050 [Paenibacillus curdlanolyticus]